MAAKAEILAIEWSDEAVQSYKINEFVESAAPTPNTQQQSAPIPNDQQQSAPIPNT